MDGWVKRLAGSSDPLKDHHTHTTATYHAARHLSVPEKLMERRSTRAGVPVLSRSVSNPSSTRRSVRPVEGASPARPAAIVCRPTQICKRGGGAGVVGKEPVGGP